MPISNWMKNKIRLLENRIENLQIDIEYRGRAYIAAYTTIAKISAYIRKCDKRFGAELICQGITNMILNWDTQDTTAYHEWNEKRKATRKRHNQEVKRGK